LNIEVREQRSDRLLTACLAMSVLGEEERDDMAKDNGYWMWTEQGYVYVHQLDMGEVQAFRRRWRRHTLLIFVVLAGLFTLYWLGPFPHVALWGFVLHP
jgi:hypothetical protein